MYSRPLYRVSPYFRRLVSVFAIRLFLYYYATFQISRHTTFRRRPGGDPVLPTNPRPRPTRLLARLSLGGSPPHQVGRPPQGPSQSQPDWAPAEGSRASQGATSALRPRNHCYEPRGRLSQTHEARAATRNAFGARYSYHESDGGAQLDEARLSRERGLRQGSRTDARSPRRAACSESVARLPWRLDLGRLPANYHANLYLTCTQTGTSPGAPVYKSKGPVPPVRMRLGSLHRRARRS